jgi:hypothetical protein
MTHSPTSLWDIRSLHLAFDALPRELGDDASQPQQNSHAAARWEPTPDFCRPPFLAGHSRDAAACLGPLVDGTGGHLGVAWADPRTARIAKRFCRLAGGRRLGMAMNGGNGQR